MTKLIDRTAEPGEIIHRTNHCNSRVEAPAPRRRTVEDAEFVRDILAVVGRFADCSFQYRPIAIIESGGTLVTIGAEIGVLIDGDGDQVSGHVGKVRIDDDRARHGPAWRAVTGLLDRHGG